MRENRALIRRRTMDGRMGMMRKSQKKGRRKKE